MKLILVLLALASSIFAESGFNEKTQYTCLNTHVMEKGKKHEVEMAKSLDRPFIFTINNKKLTTAGNVVFEYKMTKGDMESYSNDGYMLLLMKNKELGLVPKKSKGQLQYFFKCRI